jgi:hypothetical protein
MPKRHTLQKRASDKVIEELRTVIRAGVPWRPPEKYMRGYADLLFLITGFFYRVTDFIPSSDDLETARELWSHIRQDAVEEHAKHKPHSRPWGFYALEDREPRRRLTERCVCRPATDNHKFPPSHLSWFGRPRGCRCDYEDERDYLQRLGLLTDRESFSEAPSPE